MADETYHELDEPVDWTVIEQLLLNKQRAGMDWAGRASRIRLFVSDVDGVLTDAGMYYSETGDELKKFNTRDGMGFSRLRQAGIKTALVTSETTDLLIRRAMKLKIDYLYQGVTDKLACVSQLAADLSLTLDEICFVGDDLNDIELLKQVGLACCPADAAPGNKALCHYVARRRGGEGCVREVVDCLLKATDGSL
jgi:N-acylneuraminate cytidylyltransferase